MCRICVDYELGKMTDQEAFRALGEVLNYEDDEEKKNHAFELANKILDKTDSEDIMHNILSLDDFEDEEGMNQ